MNKFLYICIGIIVTFVLMIIVPNLYLTIIDRDTCREGCSRAYNDFCLWVFLISMFFGAALAYQKSLKKISYKSIFFWAILFSIIWIATTWYGLDYGYGLNLSY